MSLNMSDWRITYILNNKYKISNKSHPILKYEDPENYIIIQKKLKTSLLHHYFNDLSLFKAITIHWCAKNNCLLPPFSTIPSNGFHMMIQPLNALNSSLENFSFFKELWKGEIPKWESFIDTKTSKLYYDHTISSGEIKDIENIDQIELFIYPLTKTLVVQWVLKLSSKNLKWNKYLMLSQNASTNIEIGFLEPISNITKKTYLWTNASSGQSNISEPLITSFSTNFLNNSTIYSEIILPAGFHPKVRSKITIHESYKHNCSLYILYYLPKSVFVDKYQLENLVQFSSDNIKKIHFIWGETDLEASVWQLKKWGSILLVEIFSNYSNSPFFINFPLHLRYHPPKQDMFYTSYLPYPTAFYSCESIEDTITKHTPFISTWDLFHQYFSKNTTFHFLYNSNHDSFMTIYIPVVNSNYILLVQLGTCSMGGRAEKGTPKWLANRMKSKGLQRLRWYCQACEKQMRDENGFKCHTQSEAHVRQMLLIGENPNRHIHNYSVEFKNNFIQLLRTSHGEKRVHANNFYQEYIADKGHLRMNATRWVTLTEFVKYLGYEGICRVEETDKGLYISWIDNSPEALRRQQSIIKRDRQDKGDEEREIKMINEQVERARKMRENEVLNQESAPKELKRNESKISISLSKSSVEQKNDSIPPGEHDNSSSNKISFVKKQENVFKTMIKSNPPKQIQNKEKRPLTTAEKIILEEMEQSKRKEEYKLRQMNSKRLRIHTN
ncbi:hypothetical protein PCANB_001767 [Pneumocystis canis]|nr:hypothetical protein PCK1_002065 [Pneumocystis canis]KAG5440198.1 hypothetical protein PCANB_001767 [Pneumocystis canis]